MADDRAKRLALLRQAYETGILDEDTYRAVTEALGVAETTQAQVTGPAVVAQAGSAAAGDVRGGNHTPGREAAEEDQARD